LAIILAGGSQVNHAEAASEYQVKAAFLYNFTKFVEWPADFFPSADAPIVIGVLGDPQFADVVAQTIRGQTINGRKLVSKRLEGDDTSGCQVIFMGAVEKKRIAKALDKLKDSSVLTVGETEGFAQSGGVIGFLVENNKVGFEINAGSARQKRLKISSQLLKLAKHVRN
jgi:hypothetical protein